MTIANVHKHTYAARSGVLAMMDIRVGPVPQNMVQLHVERFLHEQGTENFGVAVLFERDVWFAQEHDAKQMGY